MIEAWAEKLAISIKGANEKETASINVMKFALIIIINFLIPCMCALMVGLMTGKSVETAVSVLTFVLVRASSGGYHFQTSTVCTVVSTIVMAVPPHISFPDQWNIYVTGFAFILFLIFAPANIKGYARMPERYFLLMKIISLIIVGSNFILLSPLLTTVFLLQGISLLVPSKEVRT
ncbi:accessory gene regulator ArgB-like protein [Paenibacillus tarimensis]